MEGTNIAPMVAKVPVQIYPIAQGDQEAGQPPNSGPVFPPHSVGGEGVLVAAKRKITIYSCDFKEIILLPYPSGLATGRM